MSAPPLQRPGSCEHPDRHLREITRAGHPTGAARCTVCGAVVSLADGSVEVSGL